jgi:hypothetical protein
MCQHLPPCPPRQAFDHRVARIIAEHWDQGWSLLCNGVIIFDDGGEFVSASARPEDRPAAAVVAGFRSGASCRAVA